MSDIKGGRYIYHLTSLGNFASIIENGLLPRIDLKTNNTKFQDVADPKILASRKSRDLDSYVPFHFFAKNPFDGRVQKDSPNENFILLVVTREFAKKNYWKIIPHHPLSGDIPEPMPYADGFEKIDWELMQKKDYSDDKCKSVCMAECLSPNKVEITNIAAIYVKTEEVCKNVRNILNKKLGNHSIFVNVNENMFVKK